MTSHTPKNSYRITKKTNKLVIFSILRHNLSKFVTHTGLYCNKQLETTFNQVGKRSLHITFKGHSRSAESLLFNGAGAIHRSLLVVCTLSELVDRLDRVSRRYSVLINVDKTKVMASNGITCCIHTCSDCSF